MLTASACTWIAPEACADPRVGSPTLAAAVIADPRYASRIVADQFGTIEAPVDGFPASGTRVRAQQPLAYLRPAWSEPERRDLDAELAAARRDVRVGKLQVQRFNIDETENLEGQLATPSLQILGDYRSAEAREALLAETLENRLALRAPTGAVIVRSHARNGQVVQPGELLFELAGEGRLALEAMPDEDAASDMASWGLQAVDGRVIPITLLSDTMDPRLHRRRLLFAVDAGETPAIGSPATLVPRTTAP